MAFCGYLKQSTSVDVPVGPFLDDADGKTAEPSLTITQPDVRLKKNAAAWAQKAAAQTLTHEENGYYEVTLDATDTNTLGLLCLAIQESGALPVRQDYLVVPAYEFDRLNDTVGPIPEFNILDRGTAQSAGASDIVLRAATPFASDDAANGLLIAAYGATQGYWQYRWVTDYVTATDTCTVDAWDVTPSGAITYILFGTAPASATALPTVLLSPGTGTGQVDLTAGIPKANTTQFAGQTVTAAAGVTLPTSVASPTNITAATGVVLGATGSAALTESYAADGAAGTLPQILYLIQQALTEFSKSGATVTVKKLDGSTTAGTLTLSDATTPTSITRAT